MIVAAILLDAAVVDNTLYRARRFATKEVEGVHVVFLSSVIMDEVLFLGTGLAVTYVSLTNVCPTWVF